VLTGVHVVPLDDRAARRVGELLGANGSNDVADAHLASLVADSDVVLTSDEDDIAKLLDTLDVHARIQHV
jgi:hypothetical protein